jgi:hypothetical protein
MWKNGPELMCGTACWHLLDVTEGNHEELQRHNLSLGRDLLIHSREANQATAAAAAVVVVVIVVV